MPLEEQAALDAARTELGNCVLNSSWVYCTAAVLISVPIGVRLKRLTPLAYAGLGGTLADLVSGYHSCTQQRLAFRQAQACLADAQAKR